MQTFFPGVLITDNALIDLRGIVVVIGQHNLARAERFADDFTETARDLVAMPYIGAPRFIENVPIRELRMFPVKNFRMYLIYYKPLASGDGIEVVRVLHHKQNAFALLAEDFDADS